jgi:hypothetical protein
MRVVAGGDRIDARKTAPNLCKHSRIFRRPIVGVFVFFLVFLFVFLPSIIVGKRFCRPENRRLVSDLFGGFAGRRVQFVELL